MFRSVEHKSFLHCKMLFIEAIQMSIKKLHDDTKTESSVTDNKLCDY